LLKNKKVKNKLILAPFNFGWDLYPNCVF
jgi:hypothetical protein